jgi:hypothetical protein
VETSRKTGRSVTDTTRLSTLKGPGGGGLYRLLAAKGRRSRRFARLSNSRPTRDLSLVDSTTGPYGKPLFQRYAVTFPVHRLHSLLPCSGVSNRLDGIGGGAGADSVWPADRDRLDERTQTINESSLRTPQLLRHDRWGDLLFICGQRGTRHMLIFEQRRTDTDIPIASQLWRDNIWDPHSLSLRTAWHGR